MYRFLFRVTVIAAIGIFFWIRAGCTGEASLNAQDVAIDRPDVELPALTPRELGDKIAESMKRLCARIH